MTAVQLSTKKQRGSKGVRKGGVDIEVDYRAASEREGETERENERRVGGRGRHAGGSERQ